MSGSVLYQVKVCLWLKVCSCDGDKILMNTILVNNGSPIQTNRRRARWNLIFMISVRTRFMTAADEWKESKLSLPGCHPQLSLELICYLTQDWQRSTAIISHLIFQNKLTKYPDSDVSVMFASFNYHRQWWWPDRAAMHWLLDGDAES